MRVYIISESNKIAIKNHLKKKFTDDELKEIEEMVEYIESNNLLRPDGDK